MFRQQGYGNVNVIYQCLDNKQVESLIIATRNNSLENFRTTIAYVIETLFCYCQTLQSV